MFWGVEFPIPVFCDEGVGEHSELASDGDERELCRLAVIDQSLIDGPSWLG
jgi:hypothetical protein